MLGERASDEQFLQIVDRTVSERRLVKLEQAAATATVTGRMKGAFSPLLGGAKKVASIAGNVATRIE